MSAVKIYDTDGNARWIDILTSSPLNVSAGQTDSACVTAVAGKKIRVHGWFALAGGTATTLTFNTKGSGAGVAISPVLANGANGGESPPITQHHYWFETVAGESLTVTTGAGSSTGLIVLYSLV